MRGDLSRTNAADACRELARQAATGLLAIEGPDGPGSVSVIDGRIVAASSPTPRARLGDRLVGASYLDERDLADALELQRSGDGHARLGVLLVERGLVSRDAVRLFIQEQVLDALFDVLRWRFGSFEFIAGEATDVPEVPLSIAVDEILVEVARRQHEWDQLSQVIPDLESIPNFRAGASSASAALEPDEFAVLASVDGERSIRALAGDLGYGEFEAARIVYGLCLLGIVEIELPEDEIGAAFDDAFASPGGREQPEEPEPDEEASDDGLVVEAELDLDPGFDPEPAWSAAEPDDEPAEPVTGTAPAEPEIARQPDPVAQARLDGELSDLIAELTGARPAADAGEVEGPEPFEAQIDAVSDHQDPSGDGGPAPADEAESEAGSWPGSDAWPDAEPWPGSDAWPDSSAAAASEPEVPAELEPDGAAAADAPAADAPAADAPAADAPAAGDLAADDWALEGAPEPEPEPHNWAVDSFSGRAPAADEVEVEPDHAGSEHPTTGPIERVEPTDDWATGPIERVEPTDDWATGPIERVEPTDDAGTDREPEHDEDQPAARADEPAHTTEPGHTAEPAYGEQPPADQPGEAPPAPSPGDPGADEGRAEPAPAPDDEPPSEPSPEAPAAPDEPAGGGDVSEFLRELSRLALDPDDGSKPKPRPGAPRVDRTTPQRDEDKPKKRGIFGWGG